MEIFNEKMRRALFVFKKLLVDFEGFYSKGPLEPSQPTPEITWNLSDSFDLYEASDLIDAVDTLFTIWHSNFFSFKTITLDHNGYFEDNLLRALIRENKKKQAIPLDLKPILKNPIKPEVLENFINNSKYLNVDLPAAKDILWNLNFTISLDSVAYEFIKESFGNHIKDFMSDNLEFPTPHLRYKRQKYELIKTIKQSIANYPPKDLEIRGNAWVFAERPPDDKEKVDFLETILALEKEGVLKIKDAASRGVVADVDESKIQAAFDELKKELLLPEEKELDEKEALEKFKREKPIFDSKSSKIIWGDKEISIPHGSKQFCVCKILLDKKVGEIVEWDEIMEEITGGEDFGKEGWRTVYDAVKAVNEKIKEKIGTKIFATSRKSFHRII